MGRANNSKVEAYGSSIAGAVFVKGLRIWDLCLDHLFLPMVETSGISASFHTHLGHHLWETSDFPVVA